MTTPDHLSAVSQGSLTVDGLAFVQLMKAGNQLAGAAENHWDATSMRVALAEWERALFAVGRLAR